jgi:acyl CoA:acetate/3-ketoacid CoA transferase alpha subunit
MKLFIERMVLIDGGTVAVEGWQESGDSLEMISALLMKDLGRIAEVAISTIEPGKEDGKV